VEPASSATHRKPVLRGPATLGLTKRQSEALAFIAVFIAVRGYSPSYSEICVGLGMSPKSKATVHAFVHQLADRGALAKKSRAHSIALTRGAA
jgi:SOS-response transcriptional repressor LexA